MLGNASKPVPQFFERVAEVVPAAVDEILYVGDRLDNDVLPARAAGMQTALIRRGPWGWIRQHDPAAETATFRIDSLAELPELIAKSNTAGNRESPARSSGVTISRVGHAVIARENDQRTPVGSVHARCGV
ncbi:HAD family hydrolase [Kitasatospora sp. NPDC001660]